MHQRDFLLEEEARNLKVLDEVTRLRIVAEVNDVLDNLELSVRAEGVSLDEVGQIVIALGIEGMPIGSGLGLTPAKAINDAVAKARSWRRT